MHMAFVTKAVSLKQNSIHLRKLHSRDILKIFLLEIGSFNESIYFELPHDSVFMLWMHLEIIVGRKFFCRNLWYPVQKALKRIHLTLLFSIFLSICFQIVVKFIWQVDILFIEIMQKGINEQTWLIEKYYKNNLFSFRH